MANNLRTIVHRKLEVVYNFRSQMQRFFGTSSTGLGTSCISVGARMFTLTMEQL